MKSLPALSLVAITLFGASPARADWEYTRWGMTPREVIASSAGRASRAPPARQNRLGRSGNWVVGREVMDGLELDATFRFYQDRLENIRLTPVQQSAETCASFLAVLERRFGAPDERTSYVTSGATWRRPESGLYLSWSLFDGRSGGRVLCDVTIQKDDTLVVRGSGR